MLTYFTEKKEEKAIQLATVSFNKGLLLLKQHISTQAEKEILQSLQQHQKTALSLLDPAFEALVKKNNLREAVVLGDILYQYRKKDYVFINRLGNYWRKLGKIKKANELYKRAFSLNKADDTAFYNLAAGIAKIPRYDGEVKQLLKKYITFNTFLLPQSDYPREPKILSRLTDVINKKHYFKRVETVQEGILEKELGGESDSGDINQVMKELRKKISLESEANKFDTENPEPIGLLKEALGHDWARLERGEKDRFLWNVLNLGLYSITEYEKGQQNASQSADPQALEEGLSLALETFIKLKAERYAYRYLDMVIAICQFLMDSNDWETNPLKEMPAKDPNDRYFNINLGLFYRKTQNLLMSLVFLIKGASVLEKLEGARHLSDIINLADQKFHQGFLDKALELYRMASLETENVDVLVSIGKTLVSLQKFEQAIQPFKDALHQDPQCQEATGELSNLQGHFSFVADEFYNVGSYVAAAENFEKALQIARTPHILLKATQAYKMQGNQAKEHALRKEWQIIKDNDRKQEVENARLKLVAAGTAALKDEDFQPAIEHFLKAYKIRPDKDTFIYLAFLYKKLNLKTALQELIKDWKSESRRR